MCREPQATESSSEKDVVRDISTTNKDIEQQCHQEGCLQTEGGWADSAMIVGEGDIAMADISSTQDDTLKVTNVICILVPI